MTLSGGLVVAGQYSSEEQVITTSLRLLMSQEQLRSDIAKGFKQIDEKDWIDSDAMFSRLDAEQVNAGGRKSRKQINASTAVFSRRAIGP